MNQATHPTIIDLIVPVYNESNHMIKHVEHMLHIVKQEGCKPHIILVDDGSQDDTWQVIQSLSKRHSEIKGIRLTRNFGKDSAIFTGLRFLLGEAVIVIDSDGQHPISLLPVILKSWREGAMIVNTVKKGRCGEKIGVRLRAKAFNYVMSRLTNSNQVGASDFKLLDKRVVDTLGRIEACGAIFRYSVANLGFPCANISMSTEPAERPSNWKFINLLHMAIRAVMFHTDIPLKALTTLTILVVGMIFLLLISLLVALWHGNVPTGYSTLLILNLLTLGIMVVGITGLAVYIKSALDILTRRSDPIVWQTTTGQIPRNEI